MSTMTGEPPHDQDHDPDHDPVAKITKTCLYEGYLLWPYRRSALKNAKRWTFGCVYPRSCAAALGEPDRTVTEVLFRGPPGAAVRVRLRFLHVVARQVLGHGPGGPRPVDSLTVDGRRHLSWQEATEREVALEPWNPAQSPGWSTALDIPGGEHLEPLVDVCGRRAGTVRRHWKRLTGQVHAEAVPVADETFRLTVRVQNTTPCPPPRPGSRGARDELAGYAFVSTHTVLHAGGDQPGAFASLLDPPQHLREAAAGCRSQGAFPVLVGEEGGGQWARTVLSSPVTLYDFPAVAPQSPGDLFDGTEIDQLLILSVLSLTEKEQQEARAADPRAREILDRCAGLAPEELLALHGTIHTRRPRLEVP
jgi:hydrogenase maturation protease